MLGSARAAVIAIAFVACGPTANRSGDDDSSGGDAGVETCTPGETRSCYTGAPGTQGVGPCVGGMQTCQSEGYWGVCLGEVTPRGEACGNSIDDNCNGMIDEDVDADGDGFATCGGDCCDSTSDGCGDPKLVNPGAFEAPGNMVDDDCDGMVDNVATATCDNGLASNSMNALDFAKAIELCQTATMADKKWGVIDAKFVLPSGTGSPNADQRSIRPTFGATTVRAGSSFVVLSTGNAAAPNQTNPSYQAFQAGRTIGSTSAFPADWLAANSNKLPNAPGCPAPNIITGSTAKDPIMLELTIRTPSNAKSFKLSTNFMSAEYPEWTCSPYNDFFVVLLDSTWAGTPQNPADKNLAFYTSPQMQKYPVGVNLAHGNTGLFQQCMNGKTGCSLGATQGTINTCAGVTELANTGMDTASSGCDSNNLVGGGTGWLVTSGNVVGGEVIKLRIAIWDTSDGQLDSLAIIDNFEWSIEPSQPGTVIN